MKKTSLLALLSLICLCSGMLAQDLKVTWTEPQVYSNKTDGFFDHFIGGNAKFIYAKFSNQARRSKSRPRIVSYSKETMTQTGVVDLIDKAQNASGRYNNLDYYKTVVLDDVLYVFFVNDIRNKKELYVESFNSSLSRQSPLKKVYELKYEAKNKKKPDFFVLYNSKIKDHLVVGGELAGNKLQNVKIEYKLLNKDFSFAASNQVELPIITIARSRGLTSDYEYGEDGNIHITSFVIMDKEQRKSLAKRESYRYPLLSIVDPNTGKIKSHSLKFENKNVFNVGYKIDGNVTKVYAFFCDLEKDPDGKATHGILYGTLNNQTFDMENVNFSYFTKAQLDKLYASDKEDRKKVKPMRSKKKQESDAESIQEDYVVEDSQSMGSDLILFCTRMHNFSTTYCDSKGRCHTEYYCEKKNVTVFKIAKDGTLTWASNLDRKITYGGWDISDVNVMRSKDKFYVSYGSYYIKEAVKKNHASKKSRAQFVDRFEYAVFDAQNGTYVKKEYKTNPDNVKAKERKYIDPKMIVVIDNVFYSNMYNNHKMLGPLLAAYGAELVGAILVFADLVSNSMDNVDPNGHPLPPSHVKRNVGIGLMVGGVVASTVVVNITHGSGSLVRIEPAK